MCDEWINADFSIHIPVNNAGDICAATCAAKSGTFPFSAGYQLKRACADFGTGFCHANNNAASPALVCAFQRLAHDRGLADALKAVIRASISQLYDCIYHIFHFIRVDEIGHAKLSRQRFPFRIDVNANNPAGTDHARALNYVQANSSQAEYSNICAGFHFGGE